MKGLIFNLLGDAIQDRYGLEVWDRCVSDAGVAGAYTALGDYPDDDLQSLVNAMAVHLGRPADDALYQLGQLAFPLLRQRYVHLFERHRSARTLLAGINSIIHAEAFQLNPGARCPHFSFRSRDADSMTLIYRSKRKMCALARAFIEGSALYYGEILELDQPECLLRGDPQCVLQLRWAR